MKRNGGIRIETYNNGHTSSTDKNSVGNYKGGREIGLERITRVSRLFLLLLLFLFLHHTCFILFISLF